MRLGILFSAIVVLSALFIWQSVEPSGASVKVVEPEDMDITHDGNVDATDLFALLEGWGLRDIPTPTPSSHPYQGEYQGTFVGPISGTVNLLVDAKGNVTSIGVSGSQSIEFVGAISTDGHLYANEIEGNDVYLATIVGTLSGDSGSGRWMDDEDNSGTWMVTRVP